MDKNKLNINTLIKLSLGTILSSVLYAFAIKCFIQAEGVNMLSTGAGGIAIIVSRLFARIGLNTDIVFSITFLLINVPLIIISYKKIGKWYTVFTFLNILIAAILNLIVDSQLFSFLNFDPVNDRLLISVCAGIMTGVSSGVALRLGSSTGGFDIISTYLGIIKKKDVGIYNFILNAMLLLIGGLLFKDWTAMLYTVLYVFVASQCMDLIYRRTRKKLVKIVTTEKDKMIEMLISISKHGITVFNCEGGYSHQPKTELETTVLEDEVKNMVEQIHKVDPQAFVSILNVYDVKGKYTIPDFK